ncbi:MAG: hypothetical protein V9E98_00315 [Candidatus Nanopelagicales bacterium]
MTLRFMSMSRSSAAGGLVVVAVAGGLVGGVDADHPDRYVPADHVEGVAVGNLRDLGLFGERHGRDDGPGLVSVRCDARTCRQQDTQSGGAGDQQ